MALLNSFHLDLAHQAACVFLLFNLTSAIFFISVNNPLTRWLARCLPPSEEEGLAQPKYLSEFQTEDPDTGIQLIRLEQTRELEQIAAFVSTIRENYFGADLTSRHKAYKSLAQEVADSTAEVAAMQMQSQTAKDHAYYQIRQTLLNQLADSTASGVKIIKHARTYPLLEGVSNSCMESIDFLMNFAAETEKTNDPQDVLMFLNLSSVNGPSMEQLRNAYMDSDELCLANYKGSLLDLVMVTEKIIWLLNRLVSNKPQLAETD
jgi:Na+/phosphate symporter